MQEKGQLRRDGGSDGVFLKNHPGRRSPEEIREAFRAAEGDSVDLFVYGTLLSEKHVRLLLNRLVPTEPATLWNYMKIVPPGAFYFIVKQRGSQVRGLLLKGLTREELARLDAFEDEGNLYYRRVVVVRDSENRRRRCLTYVGNIPALQRSFGKEVLFEDRYSQYLERKINQILQDIAPEEQETAHRALRELMGCEIDQVMESYFDGDYICNYLMIQAFNDAKPPNLQKLFDNPEIRPYADSYMKLACKHIIFNQLVESIRHQFLDAVRVSKKYYRHGLAILLAFLYYNSNRKTIERLMTELSLDRAVDGRLYREYAALCIRVVDEVYRKGKMADIIAFVSMNWYSTPIPLGAELEFSHLGARAVYAEADEDSVYDAFNWFSDFDLQRRTWRLGGHVDSHRNITSGGLGRHRGFFEYALGRFNIVGDLSRPLFDCPWAMSMVINEAVKFLDIPPHSLHISMELASVDGRAAITDKPHVDSDLACLLLLGGDLRRDENGLLREWRIFNNELDTNMSRSLNFSDRKHHFSKLDDATSGSDVMEYKYLRLKSVETDYAKIIVALKDYQLATNARPISIQRMGQSELPEQKFLRAWARSPESVTMHEIDSFIAKVEIGMNKEHNSVRLDKRRRSILENIAATLIERNRHVSEG